MQPTQFFFKLFSCKLQKKVSYNYIAKSIIMLPEKSGLELI